MGSKRRHKNRSDEMYYNENMNNNPFGIDPNALMGMLGNVDQNKLNNILNTLNQNGINMDNLNLDNENSQANYNNRDSNFNDGNNNFMGNGMPMNNGMGNINPMMLLNNLMNGRNNNRTNEDKNQNFKDIDNKIKNNVETKNNVTGREKNKREDIDPKDPNIEMLLAVRKIVNEDRVKFIDKTIYLYVNGAFEELNSNE